MPRSEPSDAPTRTPVEARRDESVWPAGALFGGISTGAAALGVWLGAPLLGATRPWALADWVAEHALWGTLAGASVALVVALGARWDPSLAHPGRRRAAAARLAVLCGLLGLLALVGALAGPGLEAWGRALPQLALGGTAATLGGLLLGRFLAGRERRRVLPPLDPARVAVVLALVTLPLAQGVRHAPDQLLGGFTLASAPVEPPDPATPTSLVEAWQVMLGR